MAKYSTFVSNNKTMNEQLISDKIDYIFYLLKLRQKTFKLSNIQVAEMVGVSVATLHRYFKKDTEMPLEVYVKLCLILKLKILTLP